MLDRAVTTVTDDGCFRVITARTTGTVEGAIRAQKARGSTAEHLGDLVTATALVRLTMAPSFRVQGLVRGRDGKGTLVADCHPDGGCRALVRETAGPIRVGPGSLIQLMRSLANGSLHQGVVEMPDDYGISGALMVYMLESEQVTSVVGVGTVLPADGNGKVAVAGGWIIQLLPECTEPPIDRMYAHMRSGFSDVKAVLRELDGDPDALQRAILEGIPFTQTATATLQHRCYCSAARVLASMATVGRAELEDMVAEAKTLDVSCDYCGTPYRIAPESLRGLLETS